MVRSANKMILWGCLLSLLICLQACAQIKSHFSKSPQPEQTCPQGTVVKNAKVREAPNMKAKILKVEPPGTVVKVSSKVNDWYQIQDESGQTGYIHHTLLNLPNNVSLPPNAALSPNENFNKQIPYTLKSAANIRPGPGTEYVPIVAMAKAGTPFMSDGRSGPWYHGATGTTTGWIHESLLHATDGFPDAASTSQRGSASEKSGGHGGAVLGMTQAGGNMMHTMGQATGNAADSMPKDSTAHGVAKLGGDVYSEMGSAAQKAASEESANPQGGGINSLAKVYGRMMNAGGQAATRAADSMPKDSALHDAAKLSGTFYSNMGSAVEKAAAEESKNPQGGGAMSIAKIYGRGASAGGQALTGAANDLPKDSALQGVGKLGGAVYTKMGSAVEKSAAEESANPQGGGVGSLVKVTGSAMTAGGQAASTAANDMPKDSALRGIAQTGGNAYSTAGSAVEHAAGGSEDTSRKVEKMGMTSAHKASIRSAPEAEAKILKEAEPNSSVTVLEQQGGWAKIRMDSIIGYIRTEDLVEKK